MDNKVYLWLAENIGKYKFTDKATKDLKVEYIKASKDEDFKRLAELYDQFRSLFYNNIYGYKNGLVDKPIISNDFDCYFVQAPDGAVPIGYYKEQRPVEAVSIVQNYLDQCRLSTSETVKELVEKWKDQRDEFSEQYNVVKKENFPSKGKVITGYALIAFNLLMVAVFSASFSFDMLEFELVLSVFERVILISVVTISVLVLFLPILIPLWIFTSRENKLLRAKVDAGEVMNLISVMEQRIDASVALSEEEFITCIRRGENTAVKRTENAHIIETMSARLEKAKAFVNKKKIQRKGLTNFAVGIFGAIDFVVLLVAFIVILTVFFWW